MDISSQLCKPQFMTKEESNIVIETLHQFKDSIIDYLRLIETLWECNDLDDVSYERTVQKYRRLPAQRKDDQLTLILGALNKLSYDKIVSVLKKGGCDDFVTVLVDKKVALLEKKYKITIHHVRKRSISNVCLTLDFYRRQKANMDNDVMSDSKETLRLLINKSKKELQDKDAGIEKRQESADKVIPLFVLLILKFRDYKNRKAILNEMNNSIPNDLDRTLTDSVCNSKKAITLAIAENHNEALECACRAQEICSYSDPCLASVLAAHDHQYVYRQRYIKTYDLHDLKEILKLGDLAIQVVNASSEDRDVQDQWKRLVLLYQVLSLLNITSMFEVKETAPHSDKYMDKLNAILKDVRNLSDTAEFRRLMSYNVCMARYKELLGDLNAAFTYQCEAMRLAEKGGVFFEKEKENIKTYRDKLRKKYAKGRREEGRIGETEN